MQTLFLERQAMNFRFRCLLFFILIKFFIHSVNCIDCFKCVSINKKNEACEDPFHNNHSVNLLVSPCWTGRRNRDGVFPATACIKLSGVYQRTGVPMVVRDCALDSGTLTTDTELVRMSHCGAFYLDGEYVNGCVQSCFEDACNHSQLIKKPVWLVSLLAVLSMAQSIVMLDMILIST